MITIFYDSLQVSQIPIRLSYHTDLNMDTVVTALRNLFGFVTGVKPQFRAHGGSSAENLALQNIQVYLSIVWTRLLEVDKLFCRRDCAWCWRTCLPNSSHGFEAELEVYLYWVVQMSMKGIPFLVSLASTLINNVKSLRGYLTKYDCSSGRQPFGVYVDIGTHS